MKSFLATLAAVFVLAGAAPCSAAESELELRGIGKDTPAASRAEGKGPASPSTDATPVRKVRIVLGSPYGN